MNSEAVLVTGGAGFIGSHVCKQLRAAGWAPVTIDNLSTGHRDSVRFGPLVAADIRDTAAVVDAIRQNRVGTVMHFAASAYIGESVEQPEMYYQNNVGGMMSLLEACRVTGVRNIVFSSSCATYGIPDKLPISEDQPQNPINPYGRTKLVCEQMLRDYGAAYGLRHISLRYFNACGADPDGELAERHDPETHLIPRLLMAAADARGHVEIFGNDYDTPDGTCVRDYIHVHDLARAHVLAADYLACGGPSTAVNLGTGRGLSILEIVEAINRLAVRPIRPTFAPRRPGDPPTLFADPEVARQLLGFSAALSDIDTIIRHAAPGFGVEIRPQHDLADAVGY